MKRKVLGQMFAGLMAFGLLAGGAAGAAFAENADLSGEISLIHYLTEDAKLAALDGLIEGFKAEYPNVTVNVEAQSMDNYADTIKLRVSTGECPDIVFGGPKSYSDLVGAGVFADLTDKEYTSRVAEGSLAPVSLDGKVYGIPLDQMANVVFYNKDIFEELGLEVPTTYSAFIDTCKALKEAGYAGSAAGYQDAISIGANMYTIYFGAPYLEQEDYAARWMSGESTADTPGLVRAAEQWKEIIGYQNDDNATITTDRAEQLFANGEAGMIIIGTWGLGAIMNYNPDGNFGGFAYPSEETAEDNAIPLNTDDTWMMSSETKSPEIVDAFFEFMTRPEVNAQWCATASQLSALTGVEVDTLPQAAQDIAALLETQKVSAWTAVGTMSGQFDTSWYQCCQDFAMDPDMTVEDFCANLDAEFAKAAK